MADLQQLPASRHFRIEQLADGMYAALHNDGREAISNAGYDNFFKPNLHFLYKRQQGKRT
jgi:hypothetical protein